MALYALDDVGDAIEATKRFLRPVERVRWLRLAVVMFFVSGGGLGLQFPGVPNTGGDIDVGDGPGPGPRPAADLPAGVDLTPELTPALVTLAVGAVAVVVALALGYAFVSAVMEFVFVESLRNEEVRLRAYVAANLRPGLRLFAFRFVVTVLSAGVIGGVLLGVGSVLGGWPPTGWGVATALGVLAVAVPAFLLAAVVVGNLLGFTTVFVVPVMLIEDRGVIPAWRRLWPTLVTQWKQFLVYAVVGFLLGIGVGLVGSFVVAVAALALAVPFVVVGGGVVLLAGLGPASGAVLLVLGILYVLLVVVVWLVVQVPLQTFLRYYALFVLGDAEPEFDAVPDARAAVRTA